MAQAIVDHQNEFLDKGPEAIEPLKMQQIADKVGVHVTTVSRAVDDKVDPDAARHFPAETVLLRRHDQRRRRRGRLGHRAAEAAGNRRRRRQAASATATMNWCSNSPPHGITVARRTVTKYRKAMGILSSRQRRDWSGAAKGGGPAADEP